MTTALDPFFYFWTSDNVAPNATVTTTGSADSAYPLANAVDVTFKNLANPSLLTGTSGRWVFDFGSAQRIDYVVIWHNFDEDLAFDLQANSSDSWVSPAWTTSATAPAKRANGYTRKVGVDTRPFSGSPTSGLRYLSLNVTGTNSVPVGIKILAFSRVRQLTQDFQWGVQDDEHAIGIRMKTDAGLPWNYDLRSAPRVLRGSAILTDANAEAVREWFRACGGGTNLTAIVPEPTNQDDVWVGFFSPGGLSITAPALTVDKVSHARVFVDANQTSLAVEEATSGDPEWN